MAVKDYMTIVHDFKASLPVRFNPHFYPGRDACQGR